MAAWPAMSTGMECCTGQVVDLFRKWRGVRYEILEPAEHIQRVIFLTILLGFVTSTACAFYMVRNVQRAIFQNEALLDYKAHHEPRIINACRRCFLW